MEEYVSERCGQYSMNGLEEREREPRPIVIMTLAIVSPHSTYVGQERRFVYCLTSDVAGKFDQCVCQP